MPTSRQPESKETRALDIVASLEWNASCSSHQIGQLRCQVINLIMTTIVLEKNICVAAWGEKKKKKTYSVCLYLGTDRDQSVLKVKVQSFFNFNFKFLVL